jgi:hypothetical protein
VDRHLLSVDLLHLRAHRLPVDHLLHLLLLLRLDRLRRLLQLLQLRRLPRQ